MQKIHNLDKWALLVQGERMALPSRRSRRIKLEVNAPAECRLHVVAHDEDGEPTGEIQFLARVLGRDVIEFISPGLISVFADGSDCYIWSVDGDNIAQSVPDAVSFTRIMERRPRNLELERITHEMQRNSQRILEAQAHQLEQLMERRFAAREALLAAEAGTRPPVAESEPSDHTDASDTPAS